MISIAKSNQVISFSSAKNKMYKKVFNNTGKTLYCGCDWSSKKTNLDSCGLQSYFPKKQKKRAARTEAEHIIPASWFFSVNNKKRQCAIEAKTLKKGSARKWCLKTDPQYKQVHNDIVNLFPAVGQINADRSNKPFVERVNTKVKSYGQCDIEIGSRGIIPPKDKRGNIARIAFYLTSAYGITYSKRQLELFKEWDKTDAIDADERAHNRRVVKVQGFGIIQ